MKETENQNPKAVSRSAQAKFITVDTLEYFIALMSENAFLAYLMKNIGISDRLGGIITSFVSLACTAQILSMIFVRPGMRLKGFTVTLMTFNQLLFALIYMIPSIKIPSGVKIAVFSASVLLANILVKMIYPTKFVWETYYAEESKISIYNATKETVSLISGMVFSLCVSTLADRLGARGEIGKGFSICAAVIFGIAVTNTALLLTVKEPSAQKTPQSAGSSLSAALMATLGDRIFRKIIVTVSLYNASRYFSSSFFGVYQTGALGFSLTYSQICAVLGMLFRAFCARPVGKVAARKGQAKCFCFSMVIYAFSFVIMTFATPANGKIMFPVYNILYNISLAGIIIPLLAFEYISAEYRTAAVSITHAIGGVVGFLAATVGGAVLEAVKKNGNKILGITVYPQQFLSAISFVGTVLTLLYFIKFVILPKRKKEP